MTQFSAREVNQFGDLRSSRYQLGLPMQAAADHLGASPTTISRTERDTKPNH